MADRTAQRATDDVAITIWPDFWTIDGTAAQLTAEGFIPDDVEWPASGREAQKWEANGVKFRLVRVRPPGYKGSFASWQAIDYWSVRGCCVEDLDGDVLQRRAIERQARELEEARWLHSAAGRAYRNMQWQRTLAALRDQGFQRFKTRILTRGAA